jgi:hypothetical protein
MASTIDVITDRDAKADEAKNAVRMLLQSAADTAIRARNVGDSALSLVWPPARNTRKALRRDILAVRQFLMQFDENLLVASPLYQQIGEERTAAWMTIRVGIRSTISRHVDEAERSVNDADLRALAWATMWISIAVLLVAAATLIATLR